DEPHYFDIEFYGKSAEGLSKYLLKGRQVAVQGELRQDRWEKDGQQRSKVVIVAGTIRPLGAPPQNSGEMGGRRYAADTIPSKTESANNQMPIPPAIDEFTDDIPF
ncbi:MAG TPA: single-stranded DNA-binding protein, partial [Rectinema sp.]|nr:single-stranded DNA-binding protein [Rectinema sp.]